MIPGGIFIAAGLILAIGGIIILGILAEAKERQERRRG